MSEPQQGSGSEEPPITLKISCPGGLKVTVDVRPTATTVRDLKLLLETKGAPPADYMRLLSRGKKLDDEDATLASLGILHRTALMGMHNEHFAQDQEGVTAIEKILREGEALKNPSVPPNVLHERITQLCCQLDAVDTNGSASLRQLRKSALARLHALEEGHQQSSDDPNNDEEEDEAK